jgi:hypothetical protein
MEVHSTFCAVKVQHTQNLCLLPHCPSVRLFALQSTYLSRCQWSTRLNERPAKCQKVAAPPLRHLTIGECLRYRTILQNNQSIDLSHLTLSKIKWMNHPNDWTHATLLMYLTAYQQEKVGMTSMSRLQCKYHIGRQHWTAGCHQVWLKHAARKKSKLHISIITVQWDIPTRQKMTR